MTTHADEILAGTSDASDAEVGRDRFGIMVNGTVCKRIVIHPSASASSTGTMYNTRNAPLRIYVPSLSCARCYRGSATGRIYSGWRDGRPFCADGAGEWPTPGGSLGGWSAWGSCGWWWRWAMG